MSEQINRLFFIDFSNAGEIERVVFKILLLIFGVSVVIAMLAELAAVYYNDSGVIDKDLAVSNNVTAFQTSGGAIMMITVAALYAIAIHVMKKGSSPIGMYIMVTLMALAFFIIGIVIVAQPQARNACIVNDAACSKKYKGGPLDPAVIKAAADAETLKRYKLGIA